MSRQSGFWMPVVLITALAACDSRSSAGTKASADAGSGGVAVYCDVSIPDVLNPFVSSDAAAADVRPLLYTPLVLYDSAAGFRPHLAQEWKWSADQRTITFTLRSDINWHDGARVTPEDVAWTVTRAADATYAYPGRGELADLEGVRVANQAVEIRFSQPVAAGLEPFARLPILPKHLLDSVPAERFRNAPYHREPVGSGPFRFAGRLPDGSVKLDRTADFPSEVGRAQLDRIVLKEVADPSAILIELRTGAVDACGLASSVAKDAAAGGNRLEPISPIPALVIALDTRKTPFRDARLRRAVSAALNRSEIAAAVSPAAKAARNYLPAESQRWTDPSIMQPDNNAPLAEALLDSAGWSIRGSDGVRRNAAGERLRFTITSYTRLQTVLTIAQAQLRRVGIDVQLRLMEPTAFFGLLTNPETRPPASAIVVVPDRVAVPDLYTELHSSGEQNLASYRSAEVDAILEKLQTVIPDAERAKLYHELQHFIATDVPIIYIVSAPRVLAVGSRLQDVRVDANGPLAHAAQWRVAKGNK